MKKKKSKNKGRSNAAPRFCRTTILAYSCGAFYKQNYSFLRAYLGADFASLIPVNHLND